MLFQLPIKNPIASIIVFLLLTAAFAFGITKLETKNSFDGELPEDDPINIQIENVKQVFGDRSLIMLGLEAENLYSLKGAEAIKALTAAARQIPYVLKDEVTSLATVDNVSAREWGVKSSPFLDDLPQDKSGWERLRADVKNNEMVYGTLISEGGNFATIVAPLDDDFDGPSVYQAAKEIKENFQGLGSVHISGAPILVEDVQVGIGKDSKRFIAIAIVLVFIGFYLCFRSFLGMLLPLIMVVMSIVWTMGAMGYLGLNITVVSNALPVIMIAVASSYGIHFMNAYLELSSSYASKEELVKATVDKIGIPILITGVTSSLGSLSLLVFKINSLQEFGFIGALGFLFATLICLCMMPAMCMVFKKVDKQKSRLEFLKTLNVLFTKKVLQHKLKFALAYVVLIPVCIWFAINIQVGDDYIKFFPATHDGRIAAEKFNENLDGIRVMNLMLDTKSEDGIKDADNFKMISEFQKYVGQIPNVGAVKSYVDVVDHLSKSIDSDEVTDMSNSSIAQYLMLQEMSATPGEINTLYDEAYTKAHLRVLLKSSNPEDHEDIQVAIDNYASKTFGDQIDLSFGGDVMHRIVLGRYIVSGKLQNILLALLIVLLTTMLVFRSIRKGLYTLLPIVVSLVLVFGFMGMVGIRLGISTSLLTAMIVGIGIDFSIHYLVSFYKNMDGDIETSLLRTSEGTGQAIAFDAFSNIAGFSVLSISGFLPVQHFGWLLAFSMLLIFINTLVLFPIMFGFTMGAKSVNQNLIHEQLKYKLS